MKNSKRTLALLAATGLVLGGVPAVAGAQSVDVQGMIGGSGSLGGAQVEGGAQGGLLSGFNLGSAAKVDPAATTTTTPAAPATSTPAAAGSLGGLDLGSLAGGSSSKATTPATSAPTSPATSTPAAAGSLGGLDLGSLASGSKAEVDAPGEPTIPGSLGAMTAPASVTNVQVGDGGTTQSALGLAAIAAIGTVGYLALTGQITIPGITPAR